MTASDPSGDGYQITGPSGASLQFESAVSGLGGACDPSTSPHVFIVKALTEPKVNGLYLLETGNNSTVVKHIGLSDNQAGSMPAVGDTGACIYYTLFKAHHDATINAWFQTNGNTIAVTDIPTIEKILQSYYYQ